MAKQLALTPVESSHIDAIGHHRGDLIIRFSGGKRYAYKDVPKDVHDDMLKAESVGRFFQSKIKGIYPHVPVDD